jgi:hypothetical protein
MAGSAGAAAGSAGGAGASQGSHGNGLGGADAGAGSGAGGAGSATAGGALKLNAATMPSAPDTTVSAVLSRSILTDAPFPFLP